MVGEQSTKSNRVAGVIVNQRDTSVKWRHTSHPAQLRDCLSETLLPPAIWCFVAHTTVRLSNGDSRAVTTCSLNRTRRSINVKVNYSRKTIRTDRTAYFLLCTAIIICSLFINCLFPIQMVLRFNSIACASRRSG